MLEPSFDMKRRWLLPLITLSVVVFPVQAWANAGTPLMWAGFLHLFFGNGLVGLLEGSLLACLFGLARTKSVVVMILANYASAWAGLWFLRGSLFNALPIDLNNGWRWFWVMVPLTYLMTLVLEWPFVAWCLRGTTGWFRQSLRASLVVQTASYVLLFGWYWAASGTSLYTQMHIVSPAELSLPESVLVYFIDPAAGGVYRRPLVGGTAERVCDLPSTDVNDRLFVRPARADTNRWDLVARLDKHYARDPQFLEVLTNLWVEAAPDWRSLHTGPPRYEGTSFNFGSVQRLGGTTNAAWEFYAGFWAGEGLTAFHNATTGRLGFSYETPFGAWAVRNAVHLPTDKVLFQLGSDQVCAFDPATLRVALLWHGRGPVPVIEKESGHTIGHPDAAPAPGTH